MPRLNTIIRQLRSLVEASVGLGKDKRVSGGRTSIDWRLDGLEIKDQHRGSTESDGYTEADDPEEVGYWMIGTPGSFGYGDYDAKVQAAIDREFGRGLLKAEPEHDEGSSYMVTLTPKGLKWFERGAR